MPDDVTSTPPSAPGGGAAGAGPVPGDGAPAPRRRRHRRATGGVPVPEETRPTSDDPLLPTRSPDDEDAGWGEGASGNDERLRRDVPPHW